MLVILSLTLIYVKIVINLRFHKSVKREPNNYRETESKNNKKKSSITYEIYKT